ncbi:hypothetical protein HYS31_03765 [Candidatus Woesearchaeota archaeon]|nr:hypothetical protein [Candidatus Woesearchaeota archaeon]
MLEKFNNVRLDLFKLHDSKDTTKNWILAKGENLKIELNVLIEETGFANTELVKHLMKKLNISIACAEKLVYLSREWYPLVYIEELVNLTNSNKYEIQNKINFLKSCKPPVVEYVAVKELTVNLCKITGAHAADGTLYGSYIAITDYHKTSITALIKWFKDFGYAPKLKQIGKNEFGIKFHSRIISRYLTKFFDFPSGCKQYSVKEPEIIRNSPLKFRKAFAFGALTFDGCVTSSNKIELCVSSKGFRDSIAEILTELNIPYKAMEQQSSRYWRLWSNALTKQEALIWSELFEPNTEKWFKLNDYINGFSKKVNSFEEAVYILNSVYPRQSGSKVILKDVLLAIQDLKRTYRYELADYLARKNNLVSYGGTWAHSLRHHLDILKRANVISVEKQKFGKKKSFGTAVREIYIFNGNSREWRVPERKI